ncbi:hypothetical protein HYY74_03680 [Candidatus Woesearchaeota archaeon]|nr:hypothetical protein [Candidatus Woesearchaeota archaeon]
MADVRKVKMARYNPPDRTQGGYRALEPPKQANQPVMLAGDTVLYFVHTGTGTVMGAVVGYVGKKGLEGYGRVLDFMDFQLFPAAAKADAAVQEAVRKVPGGSGVINIDKAIGDIWAGLIGRTPQQQEQWRGERGIPTPGKPQSGQATAPVNPNKNAEYYGDAVGNAVLWGAIGLATAVRAFTGAGAYLERRRQAAIVRQNDALAQQYHQIGIQNDEIIRQNAEIKAQLEALRQSNQASQGSAESIDAVVDGNQSEETGR